MRLLRLILAAAAGLLLLVALPLTGVTRQFEDTIYNPWFFTQEADKLDLSSAVYRLMLAELSGRQQKILGPVLQRALTENNAVLSQQLDESIKATVYYISGRAPSPLAFRLDLSSVHQSVRRELRKLFADKFQSKLQALPAQKQTTTLDQWVEETMAQLPLPLSVTETTLPEGIRFDLEAARRILSPFSGLFTFGLWAAFAAAVLLWGLTSMRVTGVILALGAGASFLAGWGTQTLARRALAEATRYMPDVMAGHSAGILDRVGFRLENFSLNCLLAGVTFILISLLLHRRAEPLPAGATAAPPQRKQFLIRAGRLVLIVLIVPVVVTPALVTPPVAYAICGALPLVAVWVFRRRMLKSTPAGGPS